MKIHGDFVSSAGDFNGDGYDDIIIGSPLDDVSYLIFGKDSGFDAVLDLSRLDGSNGFRLDGGREIYNAGFAVSGIGDFNGDGFDDLIIGAPIADPDGFRMGVSYVVFGKASDFSAALTLSNLDGNDGLILKGL